MTKTYKTVSSARTISVALSALALSAGAVWAAGGAHIEIERQAWSFSGIAGKYDQEQLQRGFKVYREVCASCHALSRVRFRNLSEPGGPEFPVESVKQLAADWPNQITDGPNDDGEMFERAARASDPILGPHANEKAARAAFNGAYPPDLSLITKARTYENHSAWPLHVVQMGKDIVTGYQEAGADYVYALLTRYKGSEPDANGMYENGAFPGNKIAMAPPLTESITVAYGDEDGAKTDGLVMPAASVEQNSKDVTAFLAWAGDPSLNSRKQIGWQVMIYLLITTILLYLGKKRLWARVK